MTDITRRHLEECIPLPRHTKISSINTVSACIFSALFCNLFSHLGFHCTIIQQPNCLKNAAKYLEYELEHSQNLITSLLVHDLPNIKILFLKFNHNSLSNPASKHTQTAVKTVSRQNWQR